MHEILQSTTVISGSCFIQACVVACKLSQKSAVVAQGLFFRYNRAVKEGDLLAISTGSLFLAAKVCDEPIGIKDFIMVTRNLLYKDFNPRNPLDNKYYRLRKTVFRGEQEILTVLGYNTTVPLPYGLAFTCLYTFIQPPDNGSTLEKLLWAQVNEIMSFPLAPEYSLSTLALASLALACDYCGLKLPDALFESLNVKLDDIEKISNGLKMWNDNKQKYIATHGGQLKET